MDISFKHNLDDMLLVLGDIAEMIPKARVQALNRTATGLRADATKEISKETGFKQKRVRNAIKVKKASKRIPVATVDAKAGFAPNLIEFVAPSQRKPGYFNQSKKLKRGGRKYKSKGVVAKAWGQKKVYEGSFIGNSKKGLKVFKRTSKARGKLTQVFGPSIRHTFVSDPITDMLTRSAAVRFDKEMKYAVRNMVMRRAKRGG